VKLYIAASPDIFAPRRISGSLRSRSVFLAHIKNRSEDAGTIATTGPKGARSTQRHKEQ